jgi:hypothetical protein
MYNPGECAGFDEKTAAWLVANNLADRTEPPPAARLGDDKWLGKKVDAPAEAVEAPKRKKG